MSSNFFYIIIYLFIPIFFAVAKDTGDGEDCLSIPSCWPREMKQTAKVQRYITHLLYCIINWQKCTDSRQEYDFIQSVRKLIIIELLYLYSECKKKKKKKKDKKTGALLPS